MEKFEVLRELIRNMERKMGVLNEFQRCCQNLTLTQCHALVEIGRAKTLSLVRLSEILELETSTVSRTVERLVKAQFVSRVTDQSNRRYVTISLTEEGGKVFRDIETEMDLQFKHILQCIPEDRQDTVIDSIRVLTQAIQLSELNQLKEGNYNV